MERYKLFPDKISKENIDEIVNYIVVIIILFSEVEIGMRKGICLFWNKDWVKGLCKIATV